MERASKLVQDAQQAAAQRDWERFEKLQSRARKDVDYIRQAKIGVLPNH